MEKLLKPAVCALVETSDGLIAIYMQQGALQRVTAEDLLSKHTV
jgi:hypothetical protein